MIEQEYLKAVLTRFLEMKKLGDKTFQRLTNMDIHWIPTEGSNSIAIIVKHVSGNMISRWTDFLTTDGEKTSRNRDVEFLDTISSVEELITIWSKGWTILLETLNSLKADDLLKSIYIRGEKHSVIEAIERQVAHYSYHVGQIVYIGKQLKGKEWDSLSIPVGKSDEFLREMLNKHK
ncbi:DUF1572 family protein [Rummeliibacillus sp. NPDC094406]|uniref:DUF1572 family protein n=1 Tax=Rummeliibacillus sp. NPDC094406 TaxID=3364511 RepID=UPI00382B7EB2